MTGKLDPHEQNVVDIVEQFGWMVMKVSSRVGDPIQCSFAYTIGLAVTFGWPELICYGLGQDTMHKMVNNAVSELKDTAIAPTIGVQLAEVAERWPVRLEPFPPQRYLDHLGWAIWFADLRGLKPPQFSCLQLTWPDRNGHYPSAPDCDAEVRRLQTPVAMTDRT